MKRRRTTARHGRAAQSLPVAPLLDDRLVRIAAGRVRAGDPLGALRLLHTPTT